MTTPPTKAPGRIMFPAILWIGIKMAVESETEWADLPFVARFCIAVVASLIITIGVIGTSRAYRL